MIYSSLNIHTLRFIALLCGLSMIMTKAASQELPDVQFEYFAYQPGDSTDWRYTETMLQDQQGFIWIATVMGLYRYDGQEMKPFFHAQDPNSLSSNHIQELYEDSKGTLWIGTRGEGINIYDRARNRFIRIEDPSVAKERVWDIIEDDNGKIWVGGRNGLSCYNYQSDSWQHFAVPTPVEQRHNVVRAIIQDSINKNILWLGTFFGLLSFDITDHTFTRHNQPLNIRNPELSLNDIMIMSLYQDVQGVIWCGSWSGGIISYNPHTSEWAKYILNKPDPDDPDWESLIFDMYHKDANNIWVATSEGFGLFSFAHRTFDFFDLGDSQIKASFYYAGLSITQDDRLLIGAFGGLLISEPLTEKDDLRFPPVITSANASGRDLTVDTSATFLQNIQLNEQERDLSFSLSTPGHLGTKSVIYGYKLEGYDNQWQNSDIPFIRYTNLSGGTYQFKYRASIDNGQTWADGSTVVHVKNQVAWWLRSWFITSAGFIIFLALGIIYYLNIRAIRKRTELKHDYEKKLATVEMAALRAQMNPHFMFNSLNAINTYILKEKTEEASIYLTKFSQLMRAVLRNSKSTLVPLEDELKALQLYIELEALRFGNEFQYSITVDPALDSTQIAFPPLLIQPYVENAIRHGLLEKEIAPRILKVIIDAKSNNKLKVTIEDNGIGRSAASEKRPVNSTSKKSYGMQITRDRIRLIEETLDITTEVSVRDLDSSNNDITGTVVEIILPKLSVIENIFVND